MPSEAKCALADGDRRWLQTRTGFACFTVTISLLSSSVLTPLPVHTLARHSHLASPQLCILHLIQRVTSAVCVWLAVKVTASYGKWSSLGVSDVSKKRALYIIGSHEYGYHSYRFSRYSPGFVGFKDVCPTVPQKFDSEGKNFRGFPSHKNKNFLTMRMKILTFPPWEKASTAIGQTSTGH